MLPKYPLSSVSINYDSRQNSDKEEAAETVTHKHAHSRQDKYHLQSKAIKLFQDVLEDGQDIS